MADNKADALYEAKNEYQLKVYYESDDDPFDCGTVSVPIFLEGTQSPFLIKVSGKNATAVAQFSNTAEVFHRLSDKLATVLDAVLINAKQKDAVSKIINGILADELLVDKSGEHEEIFDIQTAKLD